MSSLTPIFRSHVRDPFTTDIWEPFHYFNREITHPPHFPFHSNITTFGGTPFEWSETAEAHILRTELPGMKKEEVKVQVEEGKVVKISGKKKIEKEERQENWHHSERMEENFSSAFSLPENSRADQIKSSMENGVLIVTVPKREVKKHHSKNIEVKG